MLQLSDKQSEVIRARLIFGKSLKQQTVKRLNTNFKGKVKLVGKLEATSLSKIYS